MSIMASKAVATLKGWLTKFPIKAPWKVGFFSPRMYLVFPLESIDPVPDYCKRSSDMQ